MEKTFSWCALVCAALLLCASPRAAAGTGAVVTGVVRDVSGAVQMGALVQVLASDSSTVGTAFTDTRGRYAIGNLSAGRYLVRASQSLYVPATHGNVQLRTGAKTVVNLTMAALFDTAAWLPATRRGADEAADDWRWTLRSSANRPLLRVVEDGTAIEVNVESPRNRPAVQVRDWLVARTGVFGEGGVHDVLAMDRQFSGEHGDGILWADSAASPYGVSQRMEAGVESRSGIDGASRTLVRYEAHPELLAAGESGGVQVLAITSARRMNLGGALVVEAGGSIEMVQAGQRGVDARPFLRVTAHPGGVWTLRYRMASDRQMQGFDEVAAGQTDVPVALVRDGKLALESGRHQEIAFGRRLGRGTVELAYYHDALANIEVAGAGGAGTATPGEGWMADRTTGALRTLVNGSTANGTRVTVSAPVARGWLLAAEYSTGAAVAPNGQRAGPGQSAAEMLHERGAQAAGVAVKGKVLATGTHLHTSYRWQTAGTVSAVDPYGEFSGEAFLSCGMRQPLLRNRGAGGLDATIDVTNLLAQGYRPYLSADGQTVYFAQAPRTIQAGLSFTF